MSVYFPLITIVITAFNQNNVLQRALASVFKQKNIQSLEVIVVDDGSCEPVTCEIEIPQHIKFKLIRQCNRGVSNARNTGIENASGELIKFLDGDDELYEDCLKKQVSIHSGASKIVSIIGYEVCYGDSSSKGIPKFNDFKSAIFVGNIAPLHCFLYPIENVRDIHGFDESERTFDAMEDYDFNFRMAMTGIPAVTIHSIGVKYNRISGSRSSASHKVHKANSEILKYIISNHLESADLDISIVNGIIQFVSYTEDFSYWSETIESLYNKPKSRAQARSWEQLHLVARTRMKLSHSQTEKDFWTSIKQLSNYREPSSQQLAEPSYSLRLNETPFYYNMVEPVLFARAISELAQSNNVWLWGTGVWASIWLKVLATTNVEIVGIIESAPSIELYKGHQVIASRELSKHEAYNIVICSRDSYFLIRDYLKSEFPRVNIVDWMSL